MQIYWLQSYVYIYIYNKQCDSERPLLKTIDCFVLDSDL